MKDSWGIKYKGVGTETILPPLTLPSHVGWKGREYVKSPVSMTTSCLPPTLVERRERPLCLPGGSPLKKLQVVVNKIRPGHGGRGAMAESRGGGAAPSRLGLAASVTNGRASQVRRGAATQDTLVPLVGSPTEPTGARPTAWDPNPFLLLT